MNFKVRNPNKCVVCMKSHFPKGDSVNLCSDECYDEYRDIINEMSEAYADGELSYYSLEELEDN